MYPPSIETKQTLKDDVNIEYHKVKLTQGWLTRKVNKITDGQIKLKIPLNI
jgi:hypothetical protein